MKYYTLKNIFTNEVVELDQTALLEELNRDRSESWSDYDENSSDRELSEGIAHFTDYELKAVRLVP